MKQAVILAGGKGTRLHRTLGGLPKALADVGGVPLLGHQFNLLQKYGYKEVVLLLGHGASQIRAWVETLDKPGMSVRVLTDGTPRGTAGAVLAGLPDLAPEFTVLYGDTMLDVDLDRFSEWHSADAQAAGTLFLHPSDHPHDLDLVELDSGARIIRFYPYPHPEDAWLPNLVNAALYILRRDTVAQWRDQALMVDLAKDLFPAMLLAGATIRGYISSEYVKDAGTPQRLAHVRTDVATGVVQRASSRHRQRAVFIDRDGTLNYDLGYIRRAEDLHVFDFVGPALHRLNEAEWRAVVISNQPVLARGETTEAELRRIHNRLDSEVARHNAYFDRLYYCPHHPNRGFPGEVAELKVICACRKPAPGLIEQARADLNLNLTGCWLIGDSTADLGAADAAGIAAILVETGQGGLDDRHPHETGFSQPDFAAAVHFILDTYPGLSTACATLVSAMQPGDDWFVGGLARTGKSTLAATLQRELRQRGLTAEVIQLDRWVLGEAERQPGVFGRFEMPAIEAAVALVASRTNGPVELDLPYYSRRLKRRASIALHRRFEPSTIVIWEGVVAIDLARRVDRTDSAVQVESAEAGRRARFAHYDARRGISAEQSAASYAAREADEHALLRAVSQKAAYTINLDEVLHHVTSPEGPTA